MTINVAAIMKRIAAQNPQADEGALLPIVSWTR
jgi:hypothetical protein